MKRLKKTGATDEHRLDLSCFIRVYLCLSVASLFVFFSQPTGGGFVSGHGFSRAELPRLQALRCAFAAKKQLGQSRLSPYSPWVVR